MDSFSHSTFLSFFLLSSLLFPCSFAARILTAAEEKQPVAFTYHKGVLLSGPISVNLVWYGKFTASQRAVVSDFIDSLTAAREQNQQPSVSSWWAMAEKYYTQASATPPRLTLGDQILDEDCSLGRSLKNSDIEALAARGRRRRAINVVLTADDVAVEGFCMSRCGTHGSSPRSKSGRFAYIWVGDSAVQCPGQCAWPYHQPIYGPQAPPLVPPSGDVGVDGMVMNLASMIAGAVTKPSETASLWARRRRRSRRRRPAPVYTERELTRGTPASFWWTPPRAAATTPMGPTGASTSCRLSLTRQRHRVLLWCRCIGEYKDV
ncbi:hypothetical protein KSP39_PZI016651 [Platanthera zijinensis]|uniref:Uncharacterized protein n=1 Tax=Platanthera zijinensis TaxID=2320716 RepID=A0AAP0B7A6_9ASPA